MKLFPPNGGKIPVVVHPSRVETMKAKGWKEAPEEVKRKPKKEEGK
jgi:hypothetical protein